MKRKATMNDVTGNHEVRSIFNKANYFWFYAKNPYDLCSISDPIEINYHILLQKKKKKKWKVARWSDLSKKYVLPSKLSV